jgi:chorismate synthase
MVAEIEDCHKAGDTLGGVVETLVYGLPPGIGSYVHWMVLKPPVDVVL